MAAVGFIPNFWGLCIAVVITGIGVAMIHPQGARMVNVRRGKQKANPTNRRKAEREGVLWLRR